MEASPRSEMFRALFLLAGVRQLELRCESCSTAGVSVFVAPSRCVVARYAEDMTFDQVEL